MPDSPANTDFLRKLSLDPGTERMATKEELVALMERGAETRVSPKVHAEKIEAKISGSTQLEESMA